MAAAMARRVSASVIRLFPTTPSRPSMPSHSLTQVRPLYGVADGATSNTDKFEELLTAFRRVDRNLKNLKPPAEALACNPS
jgi:hypothetical protein